MGKTKKVNKTANTLTKMEYDVLLDITNRGGQTRDLDEVFTVTGEPEDVDEFIDDLIKKKYLEYKMYGVITGCYVVRKRGLIALLTYMQTKPGAVKPISEKKPKRVTVDLTSKSGVDDYLAGVKALSALVQVHGVGTVLAEGAVVDLPSIAQGVRDFGGLQAALEYCDTVGWVEVTGTATDFYSVTDTGYKIFAAHVKAS